MIAHYSINVNVVQIAQYLRLNDETVLMESKLYRPGSVSLASTSPCALPRRKLMLTQGFSSPIPP